MDFQAAPMEQVPFEASMDIHMDAAMNAAPVMEDEIMETVINESTFSEPIVEEIVEQMQQTSQVPFFLIASTLALGVVVFLVIFLRRRRSSLAPKCAKAPTEGVVKPVIDTSAVNEAAPAEVDVIASEAVSALCVDIIEEATPLTEPTVEPAAVKPESVTPVPESPCISAVELEAEVSVADPEVVPAANVVEPEVVPASDVVEETTEIPRVPAEELKMEGAAFSTEAASETVVSEADIVSSEIKVATSTEL